MSVEQFLLPDPGEGLTEAEIVSWKVEVGQHVKVNDIVVEIETAKSLVELPIPFAGEVTDLLVAEGQVVEVGTPIIAVRTGPGDEPGPAGAPKAAAAARSTTSAPARPEPAPARSETAAAGPSAAVDPATDAPAATAASTAGATDGSADSRSMSAGRTAVLVGYGVKQTEAVRRPRRKPAIVRDIARPPGEHIEQPEDAEMGALVAAHAPEIRRDNRTLAELATTLQSVPEQVRALAKPPVRKFAKDHGVDLSQVRATGDQGTVTRADVERFIAAAAAGGTDRWADGSTGSGPTGSGPATDGPGPWGSAPGVPRDRGERRIPIKGVRKMTAQAMVASAFTAPHVTEWVTIDVTRTVELVEQLRSDREFAQVKITPLTVLAKAMCVALRRYPEVNATWDEAAQEIVVKGSVNLGIAAATPRGLIVPNVKDADLMTLRELAVAIAELADTARQGRTQPAQQTGGTITITNVGVFGVDTGTPILNPGEAAIMALGVIRKQPWVVTGPDGQDTLAIRHVTNLGMSFDHRMIDGQLGSQYLADVAQILHDPGRALAWG